VGLATAAQIGDELVICMVLVSAVLPCVELCDICESLQPWVFPQGLDDYLYDRGVYGKGYSSTDPAAFKIPKASEAVCLHSVNFWALRPPSLVEHF